MKTKLLFSIMALLGLTQAVAQEYEYVPFVREDVKWVCYYDNPINPTIDFDGTYIPYGTHYYTLELKGDTVINGKSYKPLHLYSGTSINEENDTVPVYLREEDKIVYAIIPDDTKYYECPIGIGVWVDFTDFLPVGSIKIDTEFKLYDFNDLVSFYDNNSIETPSEWLALRNESSIRTDTVLIGNHMRKRLVIHTPYWDEHVIEGIGFAHTRMPGTLSITFI